MNHSWRNSDRHQSSRHPKWTENRHRTACSWWSVAKGNCRMNCRPEIWTMLDISWISLRCGVSTILFSSKTKKAKDKAQKRSPWTFCPAGCLGKRLQQIHVSFVVSISPFCMDIMVGFIPSYFCGLNAPNPLKSRLIGARGCTAVWEICNSLEGIVAWRLGHHCKSMNRWMAIPGGKSSSGQIHLSTNQGDIWTSMGTSHIVSLAYWQGLINKGYSPNKKQPSAVKMTPQSKPART